MGTISISIMSKSDPLSLPASASVLVCPGPLLDMIELAVLGCRARLSPLGVRQRCNTQRLRPHCLEEIWALIETPKENFASSQREWQA